MLGGSSYSLPLYEPLTISFYYGSYPRTDLTSAEVSLLNVATEATVSPEPIYERINPFHVDIKYAMIPQTIHGNYEIRIRQGSTVVARQPIMIEVTGKSYDLA